MVTIKSSFIFILITLFLSFSYAQGTISDIEKIILKLKGQDNLIQPPDTRTVQQIYEAISLEDKSQLLTRVVDETLTKKLWDQINTNENKKELLKAGLSESKSKELIDIWEKVREKRDFILKKMDELSENDFKNKEGFDKFMEENLKKNNVMIDPIFEFEYKELNRYILEYQEALVEPEFIRIRYDNGLVLKLPLKQLPLGLKKIEVNRTHITYSNKYQGKFIVNVTDIYPTDMGKENEWEVKGFLDLSENKYYVVINFGQDKYGQISTIKGGFVISKRAEVVIDDTHGTIYTLELLEGDESSFIKIYDSGVYLFHGNIRTTFNNNKFDFTEIAIDKSGVVTDINGRLSYQNGYFTDSQGNLDTKLSSYSSKYISIKDDTLSQDGKVVTGNFDKVIGRKFTINSQGGIDYELLTIDLVVNGGHIIQDNSLILQFGFINAERHIAGASDIFLDFTRVGTSLVDQSGRRGSSNAGRTFTNLFTDAMWIIDRYFNYSIKRFILDNFGFFLG